VLTTYDDVGRYLLARGWVSAEAIVEGDFVVTNASRRNGNFQVVSGAGSHYFLKQETRDAPTVAPRLGSVAYEAAVYEALAAVHGAKPVSTCFPRCLGFDPEEQLLVLEAFVGWVSLADHYLTKRRFSSAIGRRLGTLLAAIHRLSEEERSRIERALGLPESPPWVFALPKPDQRLYLHASLSSLQLLEILQQSEELCASFERLSRLWQNTSFIHGDVKWANCLVLPGAGKGSAELKLVDWELARLGDPCWDVGGVLSEYLAAWLSSIPISGEHPPDRFLEFARLPLERMQPAACAFWQAYCRERGLPTADVAAWLERAMSFAGVRLVQTAFEQLQLEARMDARAVFLVQLCANIVSRPLEAAVQLLGLPLPHELHGAVRLR
jgi:thiamine kinase-like enzyme